MSEFRHERNKLPPLLPQVSPLGRTLTSYLQVLEGRATAARKARQDFLERLNASFDAANRALREALAADTQAKVLTGHVDVQTASAVRVRPAPATVARQQLQEYGIAVSVDSMPRRDRKKVLNAAQSLQEIHNGPYVDNAALDQLCSALASARAYYEPLETRARALLDTIPALCEAAPRAEDQASVEAQLKQCLTVTGSLAAVLTDLQKPLGYRVGSLDKMLARRVRRFEDVVRAINDFRAQIVNDLSAARRRIDNTVGDLSQRRSGNFETFLAAEMSEYQTPVGDTAPKHAMRGAPNSADRGRAKRLANTTQGMYSTLMPSGVWLERLVRQIAHSAGPAGERMLLRRVADAASGGPAPHQVYASELAVLDDAALAAAILEQPTRLGLLLDRQSDTEHVPNPYGALTRVARAFSPAHLQMANQACRLINTLAAERHQADSDAHVGDGSLPYRFVLRVHLHGSGEGTRVEIEPVAFDIRRPILAQIGPASGKAFWQRMRTTNPATGRAEFVPHVAAKAVQEILTQNCIAAQLPHAQRAQVVLAPWAWAQYGAGIPIADLGVDEDNARALARAADTIHRDLLATKKHAFGDYHAALASQQIRYDAAAGSIKLEPMAPN